MYASSREFLSSLTSWRRPAGLRWGTGPDPLAGAVEPSVSAWLAEVASVASQIGQLNRATEADFLAIGGMLTDFMGTARQISSDISAMSESISGEAGQVACSALESILRHANRMHENAAATNNRLLEVKRLAARIGEEFSGFRQTVSTFQLVATLARIETERLGNSDSDLGNLTEEFKSHAVNVVEGVERVLEDVAAVEKRIGSTVASISSLQQQKLKMLPNSILEIERNLHAFRERRKEAVTTAETLALQFQELSFAIAEIVNSIQFHDITRQQLEHVGEVLTEWHGKASQLTPTTHPPRLQRLVLSLERAQLDSAAKLFSNSVEKMDRELQTIGAQVEQMMMAQENLRELHGGPGDSFFQEMQQNFDGIIEAIGDCELVESSVRGSMLELTAVVERLNKSSQSIRSVAIQLKWLALNAGISAIKLGQPGEPLNVIAGSMQSLQSVCETNCVGTESTIESIYSVLADPAMETVSDARSGTEIRLDVSARTTELHSSSQASTASCQRVSATAEAFGVNIQSARERLAIGLHVAGALDRCQQQLSKWGTDSHPISAEEREAFGADFQEISQRYTMQDEREVHRRLMGDAEAQPTEGAASAEAGALECGEFGDNIELF